MSLVVWLPLTKDLRQQGLNNITINNEGASFENSGKLGGCYNLTSGPIALSNLPNPSEISVAFWFKRTANTNSIQFLFTAWNGVTCELTSNGEPLFAIYRNNYTNIKGNAITTTSGWTHYCGTFNTTEGMKLYINGILIASDNLTTPISWNTTIGRLGKFQSYASASVLMNDFRIYDHCLSPMEVKELAKGLVLHYPLSDRTAQQLNNVYNYPRFETSSSGGGWNHWGQTGASGSCGQSTDIKYKFRNSQTYSHWIENALDATGHWLLYQEPTTGSTIYRSLQCIVKEANSKPITESILYPAWNGRTGGTAQGRWTSIINLGDGFYLCKCENIQQSANTSGNPSLVGFYICPGYRVYFSEAYLENDREICSDFMWNSLTTEYDCSGFCNNGIRMGTFIYTSDTPKYSISTQIAATSTGIKIPNFYIGDIWSMSVWFKYPSPDNSGWKALVILNNNGGDADLQFGNYINCSGNAVQYSANGKYTTGVTFTYGEWHHIVNTYDGTTLKCYLDGVYKTSVTPGQTLSRSNLGIGFKSSAVDFSSVGNSFTNGQLSDVRIYATALSADDVKSLYQNSAYIDSSGNVYGAVHSEV